MNHITRKVIAALSSVCLLCTSFTGIAASAAFQEDVNRGVFYQNTTPLGHSYLIAETYSYSDTFFKGNAGTYQPALATASAYMAMASGNSARIDEDHQADRDIIAFLEDIGFKNVKANADFNIEPTQDTMGVACGVKTITDENGKEVSLIAVAPRCGDYGAEWASNFRLGSEGDASGFSESAQKVLDFLKEYVQDNKITGDVKVWVSGYSRSAAVANLTAARLIDDAASVFGDAAVLEPDQVFAYTIATPQCADTNKDPHNEKYQNIHNFISKNDFIPNLAPTKYGFERYGTDHFVEELASQSEMAGYIGNIDAIVGLGYAFGKAPSDFRKRLLGMAIDGTAGSYPVDENSSNNLPETQEEFVKLLADSFTYSTGSRSNYAETLEPYLSELLGYLIPPMVKNFSSKQSDNVIAKNRYGLPLLTYLYMDYELSRIPAVLEEYPDDPDHVEMFFNKTHRLALVLRVMAGDLTEEEMAVVQAYVNSLSPEERVWIQDVLGDFSPEALEQAKEKTGFGDWQFSDECKEEMKQVFTMYCSFMKPDHIEKREVVDPETGEKTEMNVAVFKSFTEENYAASTAFVKQHLAEVYKGFAEEFLAASEVPEDVIAHQTDEAACKYMPEFFEHLLLDSPDRKDTYAEDIEDGESVSKMATILGNIEGILLPHMMGYYLAWLRAADVNYQDFEVADAAHIHGYHGIRIQEADGSDAVISGKVFDKDGNLTASFEDSKMVSNQDSWIRIQDDVLRLPLDQAYTVEITSNDTAEFALAIDEFNTYDFSVARVVEGESEADTAWRSLRIKDGDVYTLYVPKVDSPSKAWTETPLEGFRLDKQEAATEEPAPVTEEPERIYTNEKLCEMACRDYEVKLGIAPADAQLEMLPDGTAQIVLFDTEGQTLDTYAVDPETAKGLDSEGNEVDLPQTGVTSWNTAIAVGSALGMIAAGAWLMKRSLRKKEND